MVGSVRECAQRLPSEASSAGAARRFVRAALSEWGRDELAETAELLVTEVVTNAILHAGTDIDVRAQPGPAGVRVEVHDGSPLVPARRHYGDEAMTGRGLDLLDALASSWGIDASGAGKVVWFDVGEPAPHEPEPVSERSFPSSGAEVVTGRIRLLGLPVALVHATLQYGDTVLRELMLLSMAGELGDDVAPVYTTPNVDLTSILEAVESARAEGRGAIDLDLERPASDADMALERLAAVDEADRLARQDRLLTPAAVPEIAECRRWLMGQIAVQLRGGPGTRWELGSALATDAIEQPLDAGEREALLALDGAVLAADSSNRITFVSAEAAHLLGWAPEDLVGRRLTTVIPPRLREAHLAGFTRFHVTGETRLLGVPIRVPAFRRDGSELDVELLIEVLERSGGRQAFRAVITPVA